MSRYVVNQNRRYYNFKGNLPSVTMENIPASIPPNTPQTHPKLITDTTLRDGAQDPRFALMSNKAKLEYFDLLHKLDNGTGTIEAVEVFIYQKRDLWILEKLLGRGYDYPRVTTWTRAVPKDIKSLVEIAGGKIKETGILASASDHHIFDKLGYRSKEEAIEKYLVPIMSACENGIVPRVHLEDATKADIEGWVIPFIQRVLVQTEGKARFRICDTMGVGIPDPFTAMPSGIPKLVSTLVCETGAEFEFHGHNDFGLATANSMAAFAYGCKRVNAAIAGLGERTGNTPLEQVLINYIRVYGNPGLKLEALGEIVELVNKEIVPIPEKQPLVGRGIFTTQAGLHQTGVAKQREASGGLIYLPFEPEILGQRSMEFNRIGALSGMDGLIAVLNEAWYENTGEKDRFTGASRLVKEVYDFIHDSYDGAYNEAIGEYMGYRTTFYTKDELMGIARQIQSKDPERYGGR